MKIRNGFVSNSSSSSFLINIVDNYNSIGELAKEMILQRDYDDDQELIEIIDNAIKDQKYSGNDSIYFNSCNYNTFIIKLDEEYVFIETCNNVQWDLDVCNIPDELHIS